MSGSYVDAAAATIAADAAAVAAVLASTVARADDRMAEGARFMSEYGATVNNGHAPVGDVPASLGGV